MRAARPPPVRPSIAQILASYAGARVTATLRLRADKGEEKTRFGRIIGMHERIKAYTNREHGSLPGDDEMIQFGGELFETLLQGRRAAAVRRSADAAAPPTPRSRADVDDPVDRREAVGVCVRLRAPQLPRHRGDPFRPQRAHQRAGRSDRARAGAAADPRRGGTARRLRAPVDRSGSRGDPPRLHTARRRAARRHRRPRARDAGGDSRLPQDRQLPDRALHRPRRFRRRAAGRLPRVRERSRRRVHARRAGDARDLLQARPEPGVPERVRERPRRPRRLQQGRGAVARRARPAGAGRQSVQRARLVGDVVRAALLLRRWRRACRSASRRARRGSPSTTRCTASSSTGPSPCSMRAIRA